MRALNGKLGWHDVLHPDWDAQVRLDTILGKPPNLRAFRASELVGISHDQVRFWCLTEGVWQLPSIELLEILKRLIGGRRALEIGAGRGHVGRLLGIPTTDSHLHTQPAFARYMAERGAPCTGEYPPDVVQLRAREAIRAYKPEVVIGCWVTHLTTSDDFRTDGGSMYGVDESAILANWRIQRYVMVGNIDVHETKPILRVKHQTIADRGIVSRARNPHHNRVWVWSQPECSGGAPPQPTKRRKRS